MIISLGWKIIYGVCPTPGICPVATSKQFVHKYFQDEMEVSVTVLWSSEKVLQVRHQGLITQEVRLVVTVLKTNMFPVTPKALPTLKHQC